MTPRKLSATPQALAILAERVATIEGRIAACTILGGGALSAHDPRRVPTAWPEVDVALGGGLPRCGVHEWWHACDKPHARQAPIDALIHLAWQALLHDELHHPGAARKVVWVGRAVWPQAQALVRGLRTGADGMFGAACPRLWPDARLCDRTLLVDTPDRDPGARLWSIEQAARCSGVCAVVADGAGFDLPATRRLQLAASDVLLLLVRPEERRAVLSACSTRWRVRWANDARAGSACTAAMHAQPLLARLPPEPMWAVELDRAKGVGSAAYAGTSTRITRAWERTGVDAPPPRVMADIARRERRRTHRAAARDTERRIAQRDHSHAPLVFLDAAHATVSRPMLPGHRTAALG